MPTSDLQGENFFYHNIDLGIRIFKIKISRVPTSIGIIQGLIFV